MDPDWVRLHEADEATQMLFDENQKLKKEIERLQKIISDGDADSDAREAENERLRKVVDAAEALIQAQQKPGGRVPVTYYADFGRRIQTLRDALREPKKS
jgi:ATPase subunit of ABC transporter with duplicated ATPase domains